MSNKSIHDVQIVDFFVATGNYPASQAEIARAIGCTGTTVQYQVGPDHRQADTLFTRGLVGEWEGKRYLKPDVESVTTIMLTYYFPLTDHDQPDKVYLGRDEYERKKYQRGSTEIIDHVRKRMFLESSYSDILFSPEGFCYLAGRALTKWVLNLDAEINKTIRSLLAPWYMHDPIIGEVFSSMEHADRANRAAERFLIVRDSSEALRVRLAKGRREADINDEETKLIHLSMLGALTLNHPHPPSPADKTDHYFMPPELFAKLSEYARLSPTFVKFLMTEENLTLDAPFLYDTDVMLFEALAKEASRQGFRKEQPVSQTVFWKMYTTIRAQGTLYILDMLRTFLKGDALLHYSDLITDDLARNVGIKGGLVEVSNCLNAMIDMYRNGNRRSRRVRTRDHRQSR